MFVLVVFRINFSAFRNNRMKKKTTKKNHFKKESKEKIEKDSVRCVYFRFTENCAPIYFSWEFFATFSLSVDSFFDVCQCFIAKYIDIKDFFVD